MWLTTTGPLWPEFPFTPLIDVFLWALTEAIAVEHLPLEVGYVPEKKFGLTVSVIL